MAVVQSSGDLTTMNRPWYPSASMGGGGGVRLYEGVSQDYAAIWRTQPNVRTVVGFLARNIAQLGLHAYDRAGDTDRRRLTDGTAGRWLARPTPSTKISLYDLINWLVHDLAVFDNGFWAKVKAPTSGAVATVPLLPQSIELVGGGMLDPDAYRVHGSRGHRDLDPDQVLHVHGYNPDDRRHGVSPMETLRRTLAEDLAAGRYRESFWLNGARFEGVIERPASAPDWSDKARTRFKTDWQSRYSSNGSEVGGTPILEDDMKYKAASFSAKDAEYIAARKLTREEVAAAFHVHPAMVGIMEHANFANMREQHRSTYQDTLGPIMRQLEQALKLQLSDDLDMPTTAYFEFNIHDKLRGSFEEEAAALQTATGAPHMTRNEARARQNLPKIDGGDQLVTPLNVLVGGQASPTDSGSQNVRNLRSRDAAAAWDRLSPEHPNYEKQCPVCCVVWATRGMAKECEVHHSRGFKALDPDAVSQQRAHQLAFERYFDRQQAAVLPKIGAKAKAEAKASLEGVFDRGRWDEELAVDLLAVALAAAQASGDKVVDVFGGTWDVTEVAGLMEALEESSKAMASEVNDWTEDHLADALDDDDPVEASTGVFEGLITTRAAVYGKSRANTVWNFSRGVAAKASGAGFKQWRTTSGNPRESHAALDGETVAIGETFSNGAQWPGDPVLPVDERAGCECTFDILTEDT